MSRSPPTSWRTSPWTRAARWSRIRARMSRQRNPGWHREAPRPHGRGALFVRPNFPAGGRMSHFGAPARNTRQEVTMSRDDRERYDLSQPFDAQKLPDGFELVDERQVPVDPDSPLGRAMAEARQAWAQPAYVPL